MKQIKIKKIIGKIKVETGLHIGAGNDTIEIGGMDNPVLKDPTTNFPYIPGSSIKGKMRSLMEWYHGNVAESNGEPCKCGACDICTVFGCSASNKGDDKEKAKKRGPTRLIVRDAKLSKKYADEFLVGKTHLVEEKHENSINRITAVANPRPIERVVPGVEFDFEMLFRVIELNETNTQSDNNDLFKEIVLKSLALLEHDYLGGGGSRGNGKVSFQLKDESGEKISLPEV